MENGVGRAIVIAYIDTDSTCRLAPLDGMILTGIDQLYPDGRGMFTLLEWQSGTPLSPTTGGPPLVNTTMRTNATTDTNGTAAANEEEGVEQQQQQQQQTTPTIPAPLLE
jgi:hypothetical protein